MTRWAGRVNSSRAIQSELLWEIAGAARQEDGGRRRADELPAAAGGAVSRVSSWAIFSARPTHRISPATRRLFAELEQEVGPYRPWSTAIHDGGNEAAVLADLHAFLEQHLKAIQFLMNRCDWDLFIFDLMATDRFQHELWHVWDLTHRAARGRERELAALRPKLIEFWQTLDRGIGAIEADLPSDAALLMISDHGFGPIEHYVNFNVWLLEQGYIALEDSFYVKQKHWFYRQGATPEWIYGVMSRLGLGNHRVSRFRGKQDSLMDRLGESLFLSRRHIDWSRTRAYAQGNFGQIFLNLEGRQPQGCVAPEDARPLLDDLKAGLHDDPASRDGRAAGRACLRARRALPRPARPPGARSDGGAHRLAVSHDRPARLHDQQGDLAGVRADRRPSDGGDPDRRRGRRSAPGPTPRDAELLDIAPTVLHLLGVPVPDDMDGRVLTEFLDPALSPVDVPVSRRGPWPRPRPCRSTRLHPDEMPSTPPRRTPRSSDGSRSWATSETSHRSIGESAPPGRGSRGNSGGPWRSCARLPGRALRVPARPSRADRVPLRSARSNAPSESRSLSDRVPCPFGFEPPIDPGQGPDLDLLPGVFGQEEAWRT